MNRVYAIGAGILFVVAVIFGVYSYRYAKQTRPDDMRPGLEKPIPMPPVLEPGQPVTVTPGEPTPQPAQTLYASHIYNNGVHTVSGTIQMPTPCHELKIDSRIMESYPEQVVLDFTTVDTGAICVQVIADKPWSVEFKASEQARITARVNGVPVQLVWDNK